MYCESTSFTLGLCINTTPGLNNRLCVYNVPVNRLVLACDITCFLVLLSPALYRKPNFCALWLCCQQDTLMVAKVLLLPCYLHDSLFVVECVVMLSEDGSVNGPNECPYIAQCCQMIGSVVIPKLLRTQFAQTSRDYMPDLR